MSNLNPRKLPPWRKELPPAKPYREHEEVIGWRFGEEGIPDEFLGWKLIILDAKRVSDDKDPRNVPSLVIEEI